MKLGIPSNTIIPIIASLQSLGNTLIGKDEGFAVDLIDFEKTMLEVFNNYENALKKTEIFYAKVKQHYSLRSCIQSHERLYAKIAHE